VDRTADGVRSPVSRKAALRAAGSALIDLCTGGDFIAQRGFA